jgi:hypothetical protein
MRTAVRLLILIPLGLLGGACAATVAIYMLAVYVPDLGGAFASAILAAWNAFWRAVFETDDPEAITQALRRGAALPTLVLLLPIVVTALIAEIARLRGALAHMALAGALTILIPWASLGAPSQQAQSLSSAETRVLACLFFVGAASGLAYHLIAGRRRDSAPPQTRMS